MKGIPPNVTVEEIKNDLLEKELKVIEVKQFVKKVEDESGKQTEIKIPIFCVKFAEGTKVADFKKYRKVCYCLVTWERNYTPKQITQCYKCQGFMHIARNCYKKESCARCAGNHNTKNCTENDEHIKCINCGKKHQANSSSCEVYQKISNRSKFNQNSLKRSINGDDDKQLFSDYEDNVHQSIKSTKTRVSKSYSQAVRKHFVNDESPIRNQYNESNESFSSMWDEIKSIFKIINFKKIKNVMFNTINKIKGCKDAISKITYIIEGFMEIFD